MVGTSNASRTRGVAASGVAVTADVRLMHHANRNHDAEHIVNLLAIAASRPYMYYITAVTTSFT
jgi:hypothetical protein